QGQDHNQIDTVHVLLAGFEQTSSTVQDAVRRGGANVAELEKALRKAMADQARVSNPDGNIQIAPELGRLLNLADKEAQKRGDQYVSSELFLLVALDDKGATGKVLAAAGLNKDKLEQAIKDLRGGEA